MLTEQLENYLAAYSAKDIIQIEEMFADDILLRDWKISVRGRQMAVAETQKNFDAAESIEIDILRTTQSEHTIAGELRIVVDQNEVLFVVDVVTFDAAGKIASIRAYLGRED